MESEKLISRIDDLITEGIAVLSSKYSYSRVISQPYVDKELFYKWKVNTLSYLESVLGINSQHYKQFHEGCINNYYSDACIGQATLKAAKSDIEGGHLKKLESLFTADVFDDFLEMAEYLLSQGYKDPSASLIGAVLEDGLRKIAINNNVALDENDGINSLNQKVYKSNIYNKLVLKNVQVWSDIRNNADHANFNEYDKNDVVNMLTGVRDFLLKYLQ